MNIQNLKYLLEIAESGSVTAAAKVLYLSQPRLSKILAETEREYGVTIFRRENNGLTPTEAGNRFLTIARDLVREAESRERQLYSVGRNDRARVSVTRLSYICDIFLNYMLHWDKRKPLRFFYEETDLLTAIQNVYTGTSELAVAHVHNGLLEAVRTQVEGHGLALEQVGEIIPHLVVRVGHPLTRLSRPIRAEDLYDKCFVLYPDVEEVLPGVGRAPSPAEQFIKNLDWSRIGQIAYITSRGTFYDLLNQSNAVAIGAQSVDNQERVNQVVSLPFDPEFLSGFDQDMTGGVYAVTQPGRTLSEPVAGFLELLREKRY